MNLAAKSGRWLVGFILLAGCSACTGASGGLTVKDLRCEYLKNPLGIDETRPRLSWIMESGRRGEKQSAYRILVAGTPGKLDADEGDLWDTGKVESDQSVHVVYAGAELGSRRRCHWKVRVWGRDGKPSAWSRPAMWTMGLLEPSDWKARWIGRDEPDDAAGPGHFEKARWIWFPEGEPARSAPVGSRYFRRTVTIPQDRKVGSARCLMAADNEFALFVNGREVGIGRNFHVAVNVNLSGHLKAGSNTLAVEAKNIGTENNPAGLVGCLEVEFAEGDPLVVATDGKWRVSDKPSPGWKSSEFDDSGWKSAREVGAVGAAPWGKVHKPGRTRLPARMLRREFRVEKKVVNATAHVCGLGFFDLMLNDRKVGDRVMDPALSMYNKRSFYVTFDVKEHLKRGDNAVGVLLGNGRFFSPRVVLPWASTRRFGYPKLLFQMHVEYEDGTAMEVVSDGIWKLTTRGPIRANNEYDGEEYDARMEMPGWSLPGFDDSGWEKAQLVDGPGGVLESQMLEPMRVTQVIRPVGIDSPGPGTYMVDMGQAFYGTVRMKVSGPAGARVQLRTSYSRKPDGTLKTADNRTALSTDVYVLKGGGTETWSPRFRGQGYRLVEVTGFPGVPTVDNFEGLVIHTDMEPVGEFSCSHSLINQLHSNVRWGQRMYRRSVPMDPDRDERLGWLGDPAREAESDGCNFNVAALYAKWLGDIRLDQRPDGALLDVSPEHHTVLTGDIVWPSVITITSSWHRDFYGDERVLEENYESAKKWMVFVERSHLKPDSTIDFNRYGDWCDVYSIEGGPVSGTTSKPLISTAYHYNNCRIMERAARLLGKTEDAAHFAGQAEKVKAGFLKRFFDPGADRFEGGTQCSYVLPLAFGLVPPEDRAGVVANLVEDIMVKRKGHLSVGLVGMQWLMQVLSDEGHPEVAYTIATQTTRPSWGYMVSKGATTIWERWDTDTQAPGMNSEALLMLAGNLNAWFYQTLAGINPDPARPGFKHIVLRPRPVGDLRSVTAAHKSMYGRIVSDWKLEGDRFLWNVSIPVNTTATVHVPAKEAAGVTEGGKPADRAEGVTFLRMEEGAAVYEVESGSYTFASRR